MTVIFSRTVSQLQCKITQFHNEVSERQIIRFLIQAEAKYRKLIYIMKLLPIIIISVLKVGRLL